MPKGLPAGAVRRSASAWLGCRGTPCRLSLPVKCVMAMLGLIEENLRLPLTPVSERTRERIRALLQQMGVGTTVTAGAVMG